MLKPSSVTPVLGLIRGFGFFLYLSSLNVEESTICFGNSCTHHTNYECILSYLIPFFFIW
jgi:hypothetical protein